MKFTKSFLALTLAATFCTGAFAQTAIQTPGVAVGEGSVATNDTVSFGNGGLANPTTGTIVGPATPSGPQEHQTRSRLLGKPQLVFAGN